MDSIELEDPFRTRQHLFLHIMMSRQTMTADVAQEVYQTCCQMCKINRAEPFRDFLASFEEQLSFFGLELKFTQDVDLNLPCYTLVNTIDDDVAKLATDYLPQEIAFFRVVLRRIMEADELAYSIPLADTIRCASDESITPAINKTQAQSLITSLVAKRWLKLTKAKRVTLARRALAELAPYLRNLYEEEDDVDNRLRVYGACAACKQLVTTGYLCTNENCGVRVHKHCVSRYLVRQGICQGTATAPCNTSWTFTGRGYKGHAFGYNQDADDDDLDDSEEAVMPPPSRPSTSRTSTSSADRTSASSRRVSSIRA